MGGNEAVQHTVYKFDGISNGDTNYEPQCKKEKRTKLCYFLLFFIVVTALATITAGVVLLKRAKENKDLTKPDTTSAYNFPRMIRDLNEYCAPSDESHRIGLHVFLQKCQTVYFLINPHEEIFQRSHENQDVLNAIAKKFQPFVPTPLNLKRVTDQINELQNELNFLTVDEEKLKPKENQILHEIKTFLSQLMSHDYESGFYEGGWMFGPNNFCFNRICKLQEEISTLTYFFRPRTEEDVEWLIGTFLQYNETFNQHIKNLKLGVRSGMVKSKSSCQVGAKAFRENNFDIIDPRQNFSSVSIYVRSLQFYTQLSRKNFIKWETDYGQTVHQSLYSALLHGFEIPLQRYYKYLSTEHMRKCPPDRVASGLSSLPLDYEYVDGKPNFDKPTTKVLPLTGSKLNGKVLYSKILNKYTTLNVTAESVYEEGRKQVDHFYQKIVEIAKVITKTDDEDKAMVALRKRLNERDQWHGSTSFPESESDDTAHKRCKDEKSAKRFCPVRWKSMQKWKNYIDRVLAMIHPHLNNYFHFTGDKVSVPNCPIITEPHFNPALNMVFYESDAKCSIPTVFSLPFFAEKYGPKYQEWSITGHEGRPGHNFQVQGSFELFASPCVDDIQSFFHDKGIFTGFVEGWALYAENPVLSDDVRLYENNLLQKLGMYNGQILRAIRLLIDTGLHYHGTSKEWALKELRKYTLNTESFIQKEVIRYMSAPGQATSYMMGRLEFIKARARAEEELGRYFSIKEFHYQVLSLGTVPLEYLNKYIKRWLNCLKDPKRKFCEYLTTPVRSIPKSSHTSATRTQHSALMKKTKYYL